MNIEYEHQYLIKIAQEFPTALLNHIGFDYDAVLPYFNNLFLFDGAMVHGDLILQTDSNSAIDIEFLLENIDDSALGLCKQKAMALRLESGYNAYGKIICTADPENSDRRLVISSEEIYDYDIYFTQEDDADEKVEKLKNIIDNDVRLTNESPEIMYLTLALYMSSSKSKSELLLEIAQLTNEIKGLTDEEIYRIKKFQNNFLKNQISPMDELYYKIDAAIDLYFP